MNPKFANSVRLVSQQVLEILLSSSSQHWDDRHSLSCLAFYLGTGDPKSGPHARIASTLHLESSLQLQVQALAPASELGFPVIYVCSDSNISSLYADHLRERKIRFLPKYFAIQR